MSRYFLLFSSLLCSLALSAQSDVWSLNRAVEYAMANNLQVSQVRTQSLLSQLDVRQNKLLRMPNINGSANVGYQLGRTIDPTSNAFVQQNILFNTYQAQATVTVFSGGFINNSVKQSELDAQSAELNLKAISNDIGLQVATGYLNVLLVREQLSNAVAQLALIDGQLTQTDALIESGAAAPAQRLDLVAQQASAQRSAVELENQLENALLTLQQILQLDFNPNFEIEVPELQLTEVDLSRTYSFEEVFESAQITQPDIQIAELNRQSAQVGINVARSGFSPTISVFGSLNTNYSDVALDFANPDRSNVMLVQSPAIPAVINGEAASLSLLVEEGEVFPNQSFGDQINQNFGQSIGVTLNVPIYSQGRNKINVQRAELNVQQAEIQSAQARVDLQNEVQQALNGYRSAQAVYRAAENSFDAAEAAYSQSLRRYELGAANALDLLTASNRLDAARIERTRSKYQFIFNQQVIRFYLGDRLSLN
ncbi:MAG: TolC family protein [Cyanobacteria bacterium J06626_14]